MKDIKQLVSILEGNRVFIQMHNYPDPDAIASAFGLQKLLEHFGIHAVICYDGETERFTATSMLSNFSITIVPYQSITDMNFSDKVVLVDGQKYNANLTDIDGDEVACIDHHPTVIECEYAYKDVTIAGSCAALIAEYYFANGIIPEQDVASALVYGMKVDTEGFSRGVTQLDIEMYSKLFPYADNAMLDRMWHNTIELEDLAAYGSAIKNIRVFRNVGYAYIPFECPDALVAMISDFILALHVVEFSVVYAVRGEGYKFSVRSEIPELHAGEIIHQALEGCGTGGGHACMAGGYAHFSDLPGVESVRHHEIRSSFEKVIQKYRDKKCAF